MLDQPGSINNRSYFIINRDENVFNTPGVLSLGKSSKSLAENLEILGSNL